MNINLHIERLVLEGVTIESGQRHTLQAGLEAELTRLLIGGGLAPTLAEGINLSRVFTEGIELTGNNTPAQIGQQIAQSVYGGIGHE
ncbi:MAG: hypothetical protein ACXWT1_15835 [Methylobacter sp.]